MGSDGLSESEITKLLFKKFMNTTSSSHSKEFFEETIISNNDNIYSSGLLIDTPPIFTSSPNLVTVDTLVDLEKYLKFSACPDINIDQHWFDEKKEKSGSFSVDNGDDETRTILRFEKIKLDYLGRGSAAFVCNDNSGNNILQNIIPSNYSSGYGISLFYHDDDDNILKLIGWLTDSVTLNYDFGAAL